MYNMNGAPLDYPGNMNYLPSQRKPTHSYQLVEKDELQVLKDKKGELESQLKLLEKQAKENIPEIQRTPSIPYPKQQYDSTQKKVPQGPPPAKKNGASLDLIRKQEELEKQKQESSIKISGLEREKKGYQQELERVKEEFRTDNLNLKEQSIRSKVQQQAAQQSKQELELQRGQLQKDVKNLKGDNQVLREEVNNLYKQLSQFEASSKAHKGSLNDRDDRIRWLETKMKEEEMKLNETQKQLNEEKIKNNDSEKQISQLLREREKINLELEELHKSYTKRYNELHEQKLREQRELNDQKQLLAQQQRDMHSQNDYVRSLELERERILCKLEDMEQIKKKLNGRERQIVEMEVEFERLKRERGATTIIERILEKPQIIEHVTELPAPQAIVNEDIVKMREDLLYFEQDRNRLLDEANYWKHRCSELEESGDRAVTLMSHQNKQGYDNYSDKINAFREWVQVIKTKVMALINDLNVIKRNHDNTQVGSIVTQVLNRNNDILQVLSKQI